MTVATQSATISAQDTYTSPLHLRGSFNISIDDPQGATVVLQRSFDGINYKTVEQFSAATQKIGFEPEGDILYRLGCPPSGYGSGAFAVRLSQ